MIAKNIKGKSFKGCVSYVMNENATMLEAEGVWAESKEDIIRSFAMQRSGRKEVKQPVGHIPIAFSPEDKHRMTDDFMVQLAKEYMQEMGIGNTQYIIVRHNNTENPHLHIVYNRINNDLKLISVNHDYKRNIKVCKKLKDKYKLTYGKNKEKVKREKLKNPDAVKYLLHDIIKAILPYCTSEKEFQNYLQSKGINVEFKQKRTTGEIEGILFNYDGVSFKGSQIDRRFSYANLKKEFDKNRLLQEQKTKMAEDAKRKTEEKAQAVKRNIVIKGVELSDKQQETLMIGGHIFLKDMTAKDGRTLFSSYVFLDDEKKRVLLSYGNPDEFVKYGKYEMRIRDKILIENGYVAKAKVKWWGMGSYANPYLWKKNKSDSEYKESWSDPRLPKSQKEEQKPKQPIVQQKNRGRKR
jgi:hypothetical protein